MSKRQANQFINTVVYRTDMNSLKKIREQNRKIKKEMGGNLLGGGGGSRGRAQVKKDMDHHMRAYEKNVQKQKRFEEREENKRKARIEARRRKGEIHRVNERKAQRKRNEKIDVFAEEKLAHVNKERRDKIIHDLKREKSAVRLNQAMRRVNEQERKRLKSLKKQNVVSQRMTGSVLQMVGGLFSAYGAVEALSAITRTGMEFEAAGKSMLMASENAAAAKDNLKWVREEAMRLGTPLTEASKNFAGFMAAAGSKVSQEDLRAIFTGVSESATVMGLTADTQAGIFLALKQMLAKGKVMAEEFTGQLGERMPIALRAMTNALVEAGLIEGTVPEKKRAAAMYKLMQEGKILSHEILPLLGRQFSKLSRENDALAVAMNQNLSPALGKAKNHFAEMQNEFFKGGWKQGLMFIVENFNDQADAMKTLSAAVGKATQTLLDKTVGQIQLITATILTLKQELSSLKTSAKEKFEGASKALLRSAYHNMMDYTPVGSAIKGAKSLANTAFGRDLSVAVPYKSGLAPAPTPTMYRPSAAYSTPTKVEVTVRGTDGLIEVVDQRVDQGMQDQFGGVTSVMGD